MSSKLQLDVGQHNQWCTALSYKLEASVVYFAGKAQCTAEN